MSDRPRTPLPFGGGLDRASGIMVVEPAAFADLRNVHLRRGKAELRKGLDSLLELTGDTHILAIAPIRSQGLGAVITYRASNETVRLYQWSGDGTATFIDVVWTLAAGADVPRVIAADSYDRLFIAHDTPNANLRLTTQVYDVFAGTITDLTMGGSAVKFRGVRRYLAYLVGWGFGTNADPDRPEIGRTSIAADPTNFDLQHYFIAGQRGDPIVDCIPAGDVLAVRKSSESYDFFGYSRETFGIRPADLQFGQAGSRLGVTVGGINYFWSLEGPRQSVGGKSQDLSVLLDLDGPVPDALASALDYDAGFAVYLPTAKEVLFCFGQWAFVLHVEDPGQPRWSYRPLNITARCGGLLYESQGPLTGLTSVTISSIA